MRSLPTDPLAFQARVMDAMCADLFDMGARKSCRFERLDALRSISISTREAGGANNAPASNQ